MPCAMNKPSSPPDSRIYRRHDAHAHDTAVAHVAIADCDGPIRGRGDIRVRRELREGAIVTEWPLVRSYGATYGARVQQASSASSSRDVSTGADPSVPNSRRRMILVGAVPAEFRNLLRGRSPRRKKEGELLVAAAAAIVRQGGALLRLRGGVAVHVE